MNKTTISISALAILLAARAAAADDVTATSPAEPPPAPLAKTPPPYSLPWQLRAVAPGNVLRSDTTVADYDGGTTIASTLLASYKVTPRLAPLVRLAVVEDTTTVLANPLLGAIWGKPLAPAWKLGLFAAFTLPLGTAGGDDAAMDQVVTNKAGIAARSSMDNAMYAVNDHALIGGAGIAYVARGLTVQAEATVFQLSRVRGEAVQPDEHKTNLTSGIHVGYFATDWLSVGAELRYQRWLSTPVAVANDPTGALRENVSAAAGVRAHLKMAGKRWLRPGISYARGLDDPMRSTGYGIVQIDVPYAF